MQTSHRPAPVATARAAKLAALLVATLASAACRASYAPQSPVTGVDRPYPEQAPVEPTDAVPGLLAHFMADLLAERELATVEPSFAVFPAFSEGRDVGVSVNGMGVYLAEETRRRIEADVPNALVLSGDRLLGELRRNGLESADLCSVDDLVEIAPRLGVSYLVYGKVDHTTENALEGRHSVSLRWSCLRLADGRLTALVDEPAIGGEAAAQFAGAMGRPTSWDICVRGRR